MEQWLQVGTRHPDNGGQLTHRHRTVDHSRGGEHLEGRGSVGGQPAPTRRVHSLGRTRSVEHPGAPRLGEGLGLHASDDIPLHITDVAFGGRPHSTSRGRLVTAFAEQCGEQSTQLVAVEGFEGHGVAGPARCLGCCDNEVHPEVGQLCDHLLGPDVHRLQDVDQQWLADLGQQSSHQLHAGVVVGRLGQRSAQGGQHYLDAAPRVFARLQAQQSASPRRQLIGQLVEGAGPPGAGRAHHHELSTPTEPRGHGCVDSASGHGGRLGTPTQQVSVDWTGPVPPCAKAVCDLASVWTPDGIRLQDVDEQVM